MERQKYEDYWDAVRVLCQYGRGESVYSCHVESIFKYEGSLFVDDNEIRALVIAARGTNRLLHKARKGDDTPAAVGILETQFDMIKDRISQAKASNPDSPAWTEVMTYLGK
jgi:hypothetical protein